jgi:hypothetical protein
MSAAELRYPLKTGLESEPMLFAWRAFDSRAGRSQIEKLSAATDAVRRYTVDECSELARKHGASQGLLDAIASLKRGIA